MSFKVICIKYLLTYIKSQVGRVSDTVVELPNGELAKAEVHWYEAHGVGKVKLKVKRWL